MTFNNQAIGNAPLSTFTAASDEIGGVQFQRVKLVGGAQNSTEAIEGTAAFGLEVDVTRTPSTSSATLSNQAGSATNVTLLAANSSRKGAIVFNDGTSALYIKYGATASSSSYTFKVFANGLWVMPAPIYTGQIDGIWDSATGTARITEL